MEGADAPPEFEAPRTRRHGEDRTLAELPQEELIAKWEAFYDELGYLSKIIAVADRYPEERSLEIAFTDLNRFDTDMAIYLMRHPLNVLTAGEEAMRRLVPPGEELAQIHLRVKGLPRDRRIQIRDLRAKHLGQYISVEGLVRKSTEVRPRVVGALFQCLRCGTILKEEQDGQNFREPLECYEEQGGCKRSASATKFKLLTETSLYLDTQKLEIQEAPEGLRGGEEPQRLTTYVEDDLTGLITPGNRVVMNGVLRSVQKGRPGAKSTLFDIFLDVNSIEREQVEFEEIEVTEEDARLIREAGSTPDIYRLITASIAPSLYGMYVEKEALALQLFSGVPKVLPDGRRIRGDIHVLMVGDPGVGKSELLSYMSRLSPRGIYATGKAATAAGLCVSAESLIATDHGIRSIEVLSKPYFGAAERVRSMETAVAGGTVATLDDRHRSTMKPLETVWRLKPPAAMLEITSASGLSLSVTPATRVLVDHAMGQSWIQTRFVRPGMRIATASRLEFPEEPAPLLLSFLKEVATRIVLEVDPSVADAVVVGLKARYGTLRKAAARLLLTEDSLYHRWRRGKHAIPLAQLLVAARAAGISDARVAEGIRTYSQQGGHRISMPISVNEDLAYFAGLIAGDGSVERGPLGGFSIRFSNSEPGLLSRYKKLAMGLFGVQLDFTPQSSQRAATLRFHSTLVAAVLAHLGVPTSPKSCRLELPGALLNGPRAILAAYLRGLYDTDGTVQVRTSGSACLSLTTTSPALAKGVQMALLRFGIHPFQRTRHVAGRRATRLDGRQIVSRHDQFVLDIRDWDSLKRFRESIGFTHPRKQEVLDGTAARAPHSNIDLISGAGPHLRELRRVLGLSLRQIYGDREPGARAIERGEQASTKEFLLSLVDDLGSAYSSGAYDGSRVRIGDPLQQKIREAIDRSGHTGASFARGLGLSEGRVHDVFYRRTRRAPGVRVRLLERIAEQLAASDETIAREIEVAIRPYLARIAKVPARLEFLRILASGDVRWEPVKAIQVRPTAAHPTVYDLTVKDAHAFVANGILVHNTAAAVRDEFGEGRWTLEAGALVLADLGLACIDEIEKMNPQDRSAIHEAMEQQRISVAKAGITAVLQARCAVLAAANPKFGRFDEHKYISEQIDLPPALLSRFDIIFSMIDRPQADRDRELAEHVLKGHQVGEMLRRRESGIATAETHMLEEPYTPHFNPDFLRKYVAYAKRIYPVMTDEAMAAIEKKYLDIRKTGEAAGSSVPITPRQLEAIIRLSEASARLRLSSEVTIDDAERAVRIVEYWMGKVAGEEGKFDIDIIQTGISQSQREQIISLRDIINELAGPEGVADYEDIVRVAQDRGIPPAKVDSWLKRWSQEGDIYSPAKNKYKLVERL
ncbi:MAG TPA: LAGLIDADG family homing endonuclease [Thermoplasmata archaeon]|nr:LAGLIDADG family homing endonuclease [Thermoplasmata archaeon]